MSMEDSTLVNFKIYLLKNGRKESTARNYVVALRRLLQVSPTLEKNEIEKYLFELEQKGRRHSHLNNTIDLVRVYRRYKGFPEQKIDYYSKQNFVKATMSDEEIESFLNLKPWGKTQNLHNYNVWTLFYSILSFTGMRPSEVAHLTINTVDWGRDIFILEDTKTNEPRFVPIPPNIKDKIQEHISGLTSDYLFPSLEGGNHNGVGQVVDNVDWYYNFHTRIKKLGIKRKNLTVYSLRHSYVTRCLEEGIDLFTVQKLVGHHRLETTQAYSHLTTQDMCRAIRKLPLIRSSTSPKEILSSFASIIKSFRLESDKRFKFKILEENRTLKLEIEIVEELSILLLLLEDLNNQLHLLI